MINFIDPPGSNPEDDNEGDEPPVYPAPGGRAVTLQSLAIEARITTCAYCRGIHHIQKCPQLRHAVFVGFLDWRRPRARIVSAALAQSRQVYAAPRERHASAPGRVCRELRRLHQG
jgi:hypothetical protein